MSRTLQVVSADRIFVLKDGRLVERGPHTDLLAGGGLNAGLLKSTVTVWLRLTDPPEPKRHPQLLQIDERLPPLGAAVAGDALGPDQAPDAGAADAGLADGLVDGDEEHVANCGHPCCLVRWSAAACVTRVSGGLPSCMAGSGRLRRYGDDGLMGVENMIADELRRSLEIWDSQGALSMFVGGGHWSDQGEESYFDSIETSSGHPSGTVALSPPDVSVSTSPVAVTGTS